LGRSAVGSRANHQQQQDAAYANPTVHRGLHREAAIPQSIYLAASTGKKTNYLFATGHTNQRPRLETVFSVRLRRRDDIDERQNLQLRDLH
jgi:hypothetical protein